VAKLIFFLHPALASPSAMAGVVVCAGKAQSGIRTGEGEEGMNS
jgi:hypothetical protein